VSPCQAEAWCGAGALRRRACSDWCFPWRVFSFLLNFIQADGDSQCYERAPAVHGASRPPTLGHRGPAGPCPPWLRGSRWARPSLRRRAGPARCWQRVWAEGIFTQNTVTKSASGSQEIIPTLKALLLISFLDAKPRKTGITAWNAALAEQRLRESTG